MHVVKGYSVILKKWRNHGIISTRKKLGSEAEIVTTVQCSVCSQLSKRPRVVMDTLPAIIDGFY